MVRLFAKARLEFDHSAEEAAKYIGCSREYVYEVLKYPEKNPDIFQRACDYIQSAGEQLPIEKSHKKFHKYATQKGKIGF